jgi:IS4 transposase
LPFPLAYEVMDGNTSDRTTLRSFLAKIESSYGRGRRVWVMDRGIPTEAVLEEMRTADREIFYLVGTPRSKIRQYEKKVAGSALAKSARIGGSKAVCRGRRAVRVGQKRGAACEGESHAAEKTGSLTAQVARHAAQRSATRPVVVTHRGGAERSGQRFSLSPILLPPEGEAVTHNSFQFRVDQPKLRAAELQDGHYLLRSNLVGEDPAVLWERYVQLAQIEAAFKTMKSELGIRPLYHQLGHRVEAHILVAFLAYCLLVTLKNRL